MSALDDLFPASFNGATFYVDGSQTTKGGRKTVTFEYPNSDKRLVEDMGKLPDSFDVDGIVFGEDYLLDRDALRYALNISGVGILIHPFYGILQVVAKPYTISENLNELGVAKFSMTFEVADSTVTPSIITSALTTIQNFASDAINSVVSDLSDAFDIAPGSTQNFLSGLGMTNSFISLLSAAPSFIQTIIPTALNIFNATVIAFQNTTGASLLASTGLTTNIVNSFNALLNTFSSPNDGFAVMQSFFNYGNNFVIPAPTTTDRIQNQINANALITTIQTMALSNAYVQASQISYQDRQQLDSYAQILENQYQQIYNAGNISSASLDALENVRNNVRQFFDNIEQNILSITPITIPETPLTIVSFQYYGDLSEVPQLISINPTVNPTFASGTINILAPS